MLLNDLVNYLYVYEINPDPTYVAAQPGRLHVQRENYKTNSAKVPIFNDLGILLAPEHIPLHA